MEKSQKKTWSSGQRAANTFLRRFTVIELVVVLSIMGVLMAIVSRSLLKTKQKIESNEGKMKLSTGDLFSGSDSDDTEDPADGNKGDKKKVKSSQDAGGDSPFDMEDVEDAASAYPPKKRKAPGSVATVRESRNQTARRSTAFSGRRASASVTHRRKNEPVPQKENPEDLLPRPVAINAKTVKITVMDGGELEVEPFARYFFLMGSSEAQLDSYESWWSAKFNQKDVIAAGLEQKKESGINISMYNYYLRRTAVLKSSPYRCYMLRRRILSSFLNPFDDQKAEQRLITKAKREFVPCVKGEELSFTINGKKFSGRYNDKENNVFVINDTKFNLEELPESVRWRFDEKLLEEKRNNFIDNELKREREAFFKAQRERINAILQAEFPMLKKDPLINRLE